ncbi:tetratricopeptide repeat protein [Actinopolymorpha pittospori]|uniref:tetratricopeptide repeat protein n=1 Tax=Actinopolymorpha pittospori TaxID=648752 RepID=UPI0031EDFC12
MALAERSGAGIIEGDALTVLATVERHRGNPAAAVSRAEAAVAVHRRTDHHLGKARALKALGLALRECPDEALTGERAESCLREAYDLFDSFGSYEAETVS